MILQYYIVQATSIAFLGGGGGKLYKNIRAGVQPLARKHTCDVDMRRAYAIEVLDSIEDTLKVHMYWLNVQVICAGVPPLSTFKLGTVPQYRIAKGATIAVFPLCWTV